MFMFKFPNANFEQWRMVLCEWYQVCAAEHKVLSINQGVELYYFNSKNLIIYFIVLIVQFYFNSKFA